MGLRHGGWLAAVLVAASACAGDPTPAPAQDAPPGPMLAHVHGLGVNPADGALYAASHYGLFRVPADGPPQRVGDSLQDTMGFTIAGPDSFLGSGHPDPRATDEPHALGLIESADAGLTWRPVSLRGEVDFHALEAKQGLVYGYDSHVGKILVSANRKDWEPRAEIALADFAVHPTDADELVATTESGLARSTDGGAAFTPVPGTPLLTHVDWPTPNVLVGIDPQGGTHRSTDGGTTWTFGGSVTGKPQALSANGPNEVFVATESGIYASADGGLSFKARYSTAAG